MEILKFSSFASRKRDLVLNASIFHSFIVKDILNKLKTAGRSNATQQSYSDLKSYMSGQI